MAGPQTMTFEPIVSRNAKTVPVAVTMTILTRNAITGVVFGLVIPNIPRILEMVFGFLKIHISLDFFKISTHMPSVYAASNDLSSFLPCFVVASGYSLIRTPGQDMLDQHMILRMV